MRAMRSWTNSGSAAIRLERDSGDSSDVESGSARSLLLSKGANGLHAHNGAAAAAAAAGSSLVAHWRNPRLSSLILLVTVIGLVFLLTMIWAMSSLTFRAAPASDRLTTTALMLEQGFLSSCSILNPNLTVNLVNYAQTLQRRHVHADCTDFYFTRTCRHEGHTFEPRWLVFHIRPAVKGGQAGGLGDRLKGLFTIMTLAMLTGRAFAIHCEDVLPFRTYYTPAVLHWLEWEELQPEVRLGAVTQTLDWIYFGAEHVLSRNSPNWRLNWTQTELVRVQFNLNNFPDLLENLHTSRAYRAFGFHAATEKGDLDLYWECLHDYALAFSPHVTAVLNPLMAQLGRQPVPSWSEREAMAIETARGSADWETFLYQYWFPRSPSHALSHIHAHPAIASSSPSSLFSPLSPPPQPGPHTPFSPLRPKTVLPSRVYCMQVRMGLNGHQTTTSNASLAFKDTEGFFKSEHFPVIFRQFEALISRDQQASGNTSYALLLTSDSPDFFAAVPRSLQQAASIDVPGPISHIDRLDVVTSLQTIRAAFVKTIVTHFLLGECDIAVVSATGFGTTARWRSRNRGLLRPLSSRAYDGTWLVSHYNTTFSSYRHKRGSGGRETAMEYFPISEPVQRIIDAEILTNATVRQALQAKRYGMEQSSAELPYEPPADPMSSPRYVLYDKQEGRIDEDDVYADDES